MKQGIPTWLRAVLALGIGSIVAPLFHVAIGFFAPAGFQDLRHATPSNVVLTLATAWFFSAAITVVVGGVLWAPLHRYGYDGFVSYSLVALASSLVLDIVTGLTGFSIIGIGMAIGNAIGVRCTERILVSIDGSASTTSTTD